MREITSPSAAMAPSLRFDQLQPDLITWAAQGRYQSHGPELVPCADRIQSQDHCAWQMAMESLRFLDVHDFVPAKEAESLHTSEHTASRQ